VCVVPQVSFLLCSRTFGSLSDLRQTNVYIELHRKLQRTSLASVDGLVLVEMPVESGVGANTAPRCVRISVACPAVSEPSATAFITMDLTKVSV
jgi:hypothetical protein